MKLIPRSLYARILTTMLLIIALCSLTIGIIISESFDDIIAQQLQKRGKDIANNVAMASGNYILMEDLYNLYELADQMIASSEDVRYVMIIDSSQRLLAHTFHGGVPQRLLADLNNTDRETVLVYTSPEGPIHDIFMPIEGGSVGYVRVGMTEQYIRRTLNEHLREICLAVSCICVLAVLLSSRIARMITRPISNLAAVAKSITKGRLKKRADTKTAGEVGELAVVFNEMTVSLIKASEEKAKLLSQLQAKEEMRNNLIAKLMTAQEDERKRISRELHDETSQALTSLMLTMRVLAEDAANQEQKDALLVGRDVAADILREVRDLAVELRPPALDDLGLVAALEKYVNTFALRHDLIINITVLGRDMVDSQIAVALYRIVQESLSNVVQHAAAKQVSLEINFGSDCTALTITDDGRGIMPADLARACREQRLGLYGMRERVELLQGEMQISQAAGGGTVLFIKIPQYKLN